MAFSDPIVGGNNQLVRSAIQSDGFITGVTGWIISKDGTAEFSGAIVRGALIITGIAPAELRIQTLGILPGSQFTDDGGNVYLLQTLSAAGGLVMSRSGAAQPDIRIGPDAAVTFNTVWIRGGGAGLQGIGMEQGTGFLRMVTAVSRTFDTYTNIALSSGWTNFGAPYPPLRAIKLSSGMIHVEGTIAPGVTANGTLIGTLPAGMRPLVFTRRVNWVELGFAGFVDIQTNGGMLISGSAGVVTCSLNCQFAAI